MQKTFYGMMPLVFTGRLTHLSVSSLLLCRVRLLSPISFPLYSFFPHPTHRCETEEDEKKSRACLTNQIKVLVSTWEPISSRDSSLAIGAPASPNSAALSPLLPPEKLLPPVKGSLMAGATWKVDRAEEECGWGRSSSCCSSGRWDCWSRLSLPPRSVGAERWLRKTWIEYLLMCGIFKTFLC